MGRFRLDIRNNFFSVRVIRLWNSSPREVLKRCQDVALGGVGFSGSGVTVAVLDGRLDMKAC